MRQWRAPNRCIFAVEDKARSLVARLKERGSTIATAESLTGGRIAAAITSVPGSSEIFPGGIVSYCDRIKAELLGVPETLLAQYGAVSEPVARAMAQGAAQRLKTDFAVSATGLAGPDGDGSGQPVGTVFLGLYAEGKTWCSHLTLGGSREQIQHQTVEKALELALSALEGGPC